MQTADFNHEDFTSAGMAEADKHLLVKFFTEPRQNMTRTQEEGRPIFEEVECVDIRVPGQRDSTIVRKATYKDKTRFPEHYRMFKARVEGAEEKLDGTPLTEYPAVSRTMVEELAFFNVRTVENLANVSDNAASKFMGGNGMKRAAQEWLEKADKDGEVNRLKAELAERDDRLDAMQAQIDKLLTPAEDTPLKATGLDEETAPEAETPKKTRRRKTAE